MKDCDLLILSIWQQLPRKAIMFDVVDGLEVKHSEEGDKRVNDQWLQPEDQIRHNCIYYTCYYAQNRIIGYKTLSQPLLILVNSFPRVYNASSYELIYVFSLL